MRRPKSDAVFRRSIPSRLVDHQAEEAKNIHVIIRSLAVFAAVFSILALAVAPVSAEKPNQFHFVDHPDGSETGPFGECGEGLPLTVYTTGTVSGTVTLDENGDFLSISLTARTTDTVTNIENGLVADYRI